jgi:hypothetical protein
MDYPWPQSWHLDDDVLFTQEEWDSAVEDFPKAMAAIQRIPEICLEGRRLAAPTFWLQQKEAWRSNFEKELSIFRKEDEEWGGDLQHALGAMKSIQSEIQGIECEITQRKEELIAQIQAVKRLADLAIFRLPESRKFSLKGVSDEVLSIKAAAEEKVAPLKKWFQEFQIAELAEKKELEKELVWFKN